MTSEQHTYTSSEPFQLGRRRNHTRPGQRKFFFSYPGRELNSWPSEYSMFIGRSNHWNGGSRVRFPFPWQESNSRRSEYYMFIGCSNHWNGGSRVRFPCPRQELNLRPSVSVVGTSDKHVVFGASWVQFLPGEWKFPLSRASMVSPPSKLEMFTGNVCVLLTSVSLK